MRRVKRVMVQQTRAYMYVVLSLLLSSEEERAMAYRIREMRVRIACVDLRSRGKRWRFRSRWSLFAVIVVFLAVGRRRRVKKCVVSRFFSDRSSRMCKD